MNANSFKAFGYLVLSLNLFSTGIIEMLRGYDFSVAQPMQMHVAFIAISIVGLGLIGLRKWAAIYFSVPLFLFGLLIFLGSIEPVPFPWNLLCMSWGVSLMLPAVVTVRLWPYLSWRGKWFF